MPTEITPAKRRILIAGSVARTLAGLAVIAVGLVAMPDVLAFDKPWQAIVLLAAGIAVWGLYLRRAIRLISVARYPRIRSAETLTVSTALFVAVFATIYVMLSTADAGAFSEPLDHFTGAYFAMTVLATVGFGDITPVTDLARGIAMAQMALDLFIVGLAVRVLGGTAARVVKDRQPG